MREIHHIYKKRNEIYFIYFFFEETVFKKNITKCEKKKTNVEKIDCYTEFQKHLKKKQKINK